jgi:hypothetical protein
MPRTPSSKRVETLEQQKRDLLAELKKARAEMAKRKREDDRRRQVLLGAASLKHLSKIHLTTLVRTVIPDYVKAPDDLALFAEWLPKKVTEPEAADATEPG